jgi:hypothetical protein
MDTTAAGGSLYFVASINRMFEPGLCFDVTAIPTLLKPDETFRVYCNAAGFRVERPHFCACPHPATVKSRR